MFRLVIAAVVAVSMAGVASEGFARGNPYHPINTLIKGAPPACAATFTCRPRP